MRGSRLAVAVGVVLLGPVAPAVAAPDLTVSASHDAATFLRTTAPNTTVYGGTLKVTVRNAGADPTDGTAVQVTDALPTGLAALTNNPGFNAGPTAASGAGWTCSGTATSTCTRSDVLAPGASYPPITITVSVANNAAASLTNAPAVQGGGDTTASGASDVIATAVDQCPNGFNAGVPISFGPPYPVLDSGVFNTERADGCSVLDVIWAAPLTDHAAFVQRVDDTTASFGLTQAQRDAIHNAANASQIATANDHQIDNNCTQRIALSLDDGPSAYRPATMQNLRDRLAHATLFDVAVRTEANPAIARFERDEGHVVLSHTYDHPHLNALSTALQIAEMNKAEDTFNRLGLPITFRAMRPPFFEANAGTSATIGSTLGYTLNTMRIETTDYEPTNTPQQSATAIINQFRPGAIILLHDGPIDTPAGANSRDAIPIVVDTARQRGYCMGVLDSKGNVVADRYISSGRPIPQITAPVPYVPIVRAGTPPDPWVLVPQPLKLSASNTPLLPARGSTGNTLTLTVTNVSSDPTDGSTTTLSDRLPTGLTATAAAGTGWTCSGTTTRTCTRNDVLAPGASFPPVTITYSVSSTAAYRLANPPQVTGHGGNVWVDAITQNISLGVPANGDVNATVPPTLSLTLGTPAAFGAFTPGVAKDYSAGMTATVISSAGDATLTVMDPSGTATGHLVNGAFSLPSALKANTQALPATIKTYDNPTSNDVVPITFTQSIGANDALRTGTYSKVLTFTLSTTTP